MAIPVKLPAFEGPLDLLLHLLDKNQVDIYDIPIVEITNQYMAYIRQMEREDLGIMSEFMVMAATLLDIKCRMLLPKEINEEGEEEDPRAELVQRLLEYKMYKYISGELRERMEAAERSVFRVSSLPEEVLAYQEPVDTDKLLQAVTLPRLSVIFQTLLRQQEDKVDPIRSRFGRIEEEEVSLPEALHTVRAYARGHERFSFRDLLSPGSGRTQVIVTFLAVLEMMKVGEVFISQENLFDDIVIESRPCAKGAVLQDVYEY